MSKKTRANIAGQTFGKLKVIEYAFTNKAGKSVWKCSCECGNVSFVPGCHLSSGHTKSCGCLKKEESSKRLKKHGMKQTKIYRTWLNVKARCTIKSVPCFKYYGGRGITICDEWRDDFQAFYDYVSALPHYDEPGYSLDRINNDGNYEPGNVRWATAKEQRANQRRII